MYRVLLHEDGELCILCFTDKCRNCRVPCVGGLCICCMGKQKCRNCGRHLGSELYESDTALNCKTCVRKLAKQAAREPREIFNKLLQEIPLRVDTNDVGDLEAYFSNRQDEIEDHLRSAIIENG